MRTLIIIFLSLAVFACAAETPTAKSRANIYSEIDSLFPSDQARAITAERLRTSLKNIAASSQNFTTDGTALVASEATTTATAAKIPRADGNGKISLDWLDTSNLSLILRQGSDAERQTVIFASGEPVWTTDTKRLYVGDGTTLGGVDFAPVRSVAGKTGVVTLAGEDVTTGTISTARLPNTIEAQNASYLTLRGSTDSGLTGAEVAIANGNSGNVVNFTGRDGLFATFRSTTQGAYIAIESYGDVAETGPRIMLKRYGGQRSGGATTGALNGHVLGDVSFYGRRTSSIALYTGAKVIADALEDFSTGHAGSRLKLQVAPVGSTTLVDALAVSGAVATFGVPVSIPTAPPAAANSSGVAGTVTWDANYVYICVATDTWKRVAIATW